MANAVSVPKPRLELGLTVFRIIYVGLVGSSLTMEFHTLFLLRTFNWRLNLGLLHMIYQ